MASSTRSADARPALGVVRELANWNLALKHDSERMRRLGFALLRSQNRAAEHTFPPGAWIDKAAAAVTRETEAISRETLLHTVKAASRARAVQAHKSTHEGECVRC